MRPPKAVPRSGHEGALKEADNQPHCLGLRLYRDARVTTIYEGTSEVQRIVIARAVLKDVSP